MNKIFKSKYNASTGQWVACSELASNRSKTGNSRALKAILALSLGLGVEQALAAQCASLNAFGGGTCEVYEGAYTSTIGWQSAVLASSGNKTVVKSASDSSLGNFTVTSSTSSRYTDYSSSGFAVNNGSLTADTLSVTITPESGKTVRTFGATVFNAGTLTANTLNANITFARENTNVRSPIESYAVQVGTAVTGEDSAVGKTSKMTVKDANLTITNTAATQTNYTRFGFTFPTFGRYQLSGIRVISREDNGGSNAIFESTGKVTINAFDSSTAGTADYINGIYVSGENNKAILNDSEITIGKSGTHSAALKIGKIRTVGTGSSSIESNGNMILDTTAESRAVTVRVIGDESKLLANFNNSSGEIKSAGIAIDFSSNDWGSSGLGQNQEVRLKDTKITTLNASNGVDNTNPLINVNAGTTTKNATALFELTGNNSSAVASDYGWLLDVKSNAALTVNNTDKGFMTGLSNIAMNAAGTAPDDSTLNVNLADGFTWNLNTKQASGANLESKTATLTSLNLTSQAVLNAAYDAAGNNNYTVKAVNTDGSMGNVTSDNGIINLVNAGSTPAYNDTLTIDGNYEGKNGAVVRMNTLWNDHGDEAITVAEGGADSESDVLHILGTATGETTVVPVKADGTTLSFIDGTLRDRGTETFNTVPVVIVEDDTAGGKFVGKAQMTNINEVQLTSRADPTDATGKRRQYYWTYKSNENTDIIVPIVPVVVQTPKINMEQGLATLATMHERRGDNMPMLWDSCGCVDGKAENQTWGRIFGERLNLDGKYRVNSRTNQYGIQLGHDWRLDNTNKGTRRWLGVYAAYNRGNSKVYDRYRTVNGFVSDDKYVGGVHSHHVSLGLTHTRYRPNGSYWDFVGQLSWVGNKLSARDGKSATQNGVAAVLSAEVGRPYMIGDKKPNESKWVIEPQAQLSYSLLHLNKAVFDAQNVVASGNHHGLRGRVGARLSHYSQNGHFTNTFYGIANIYADLMRGSSATFGLANGTKLTERYSRVWGELGVGMDLPTSKHGHVYADIRAQRHLGGSAERVAYRGTIGYKYTW